MAERVAGAHDIVVPFRQMKQQSVDNLDWMATRGYLGAIHAERRFCHRGAYDYEQTRDFEEYVDALHRRAVHELVIRARRSAPKRRLR